MKIWVLFKKVWDCSHIMVIALWDVVHMTFERDDGIWIFDIHQDRIPQLCAWYRDNFLPHGCSLIIYMYISAVSGYSWWYLVPEVKVNLFFTFKSASTYRFSCIKDATFNRKMRLKLIHLMSFNSGVTPSRFKYFPLLASFAAKLMHFCTS